MNAEKFIAKLPQPTAAHPSDAQGLDVVLEGTGAQQTDLDKSLVTSFNPKRFHKAAIPTPR